MRSVLITGAKGAGKTTVADVLEREFGYVHLALADPLRMEVAGMLADSLSSLGGSLPALSLDRWIRARNQFFHDMKEQGPTKDLLRGFLQYWGTEVRRAADSDYWVNKTKQIIRGRADEFFYSPSLVPPVFVIDDVSFENEVTAFDPWPVVRVVRPGAASTDDHASEVGRRSIKADFTITNNDSIGLLQAKARWLAEWLAGSIVTGTTEI